VKRCWPSDLEPAMSSKRFVINLIGMLVVLISGFPGLQVTMVGPEGAKKVVGRPSDVAAGERTSDVTARIAQR
jgi:hypothetical protein